MSIRIFSILHFSLLLQLWCCSSNKVYGQEQLSKGLLWEISISSAPNKSYLYGTIHVQDKRVFDFADSVMICFKNCQQYAGEIIIDNIDAKTLAPQMLLSKGQSLKSLIGKKYFKKIKIYLRQHRMGMYALVINKMKPFVVMAILSENDLPKDKSLVLDDYLQKLAKNNHMKVVGLETVEEQMGAVNKIPLDKQVTMLRLVVDSLKNSAAPQDNSYEDMLKIYLDQDIEQLQSFAEDNDELSTEFVNHVLLERNHRMTERIINLIKTQPTFIGVGAAHLAGKQGIIALLKSSGYTVRPVLAGFSKK